MSRFTHFNIQNTVHKPGKKYLIFKIHKRGYFNGSTSTYKDAILDSNNFILAKCLAVQNDIDYVIIGHYHQHKDIRLENGQFLILGDWIEYHSYGFFDGESLSLKNWENEKVEY